MRYHEVLNWYDRELKRLWSQNLSKPLESVAIAELYKSFEEKLSAADPEPLGTGPELPEAEIVRFAREFASKRVPGFGSPYVESVAVHEKTRHWVVKLLSEKPSENHLGGSYMNLLVDTYTGEVLWHSGGGG